MGKPCYVKWTVNKSSVFIFLRIILRFFYNFLFVSVKVCVRTGYLTHKAGVLGSIPGLATYFRFSFRFFKKGSCESMCTKYWLIV